MLARYLANITVFFLFCFLFNMGEYSDSYIDLNLAVAYMKGGF